MAGAKGRSGGARRGAGRPKKDAVKLSSDLLAKALLHTDPKAFLLAVMNDGESDAKLRVEAAKTLMPFMHSKMADVGKKEQKATDAKRAANKFAAAAPPKLVVSNRR